MQITGSQFPVRRVLACRRVLATASQVKRMSVAVTISPHSAWPTTIQHESQRPYSRSLITRIVRQEQLAKMACHFRCSAEMLRR